MDFNNIISKYSNGKYTFDTLRADNASEMVETGYLAGLIRAMVNDVLTQKRAVNKFAQFKKKRGYSGKIINRTYVNPTTGKEFTVDGLTKLFDLAPADVKGAISKYTKPLQYDTTYNKDEIRKAFVSEQALLDFLNQIIGSLYNGSEIDDKANFIQLFNDLYNENQAVVISTQAVTKATVEDFAVELKTIVENFKEESDQWNVWKRLNPTDTSAVFWSNPEDINIILPISVSARLDISLLAQLFNVERAALDGRVFTVADGKLASGIQAIVFDSTLVSIDEIYAELEPTFYDSTKRRYKEVYNTNNQYAINPFANCVILATSIPTVSPAVVRSKTVKVASGVTKVVPIEVAPIGANQSITASASGDATVSVTYDEILGYTLSINATEDDTVTFSGLSGTITVTVE